MKETAFDIRLFSESLERFNLTLQEAATAIRRLNEALRASLLKGCILVRARLIDEFISWNMPERIASWIVWHLPYRIVGKVIMILRHDRPIPSGGSEA